MSKKSIRQLYAEHTGKVSDKWSSYLPEYERLFSGYRDSQVRLFEIGIQNGGSLEIWSKYFDNPQALIGCDINPDCLQLSYNDPRVAVIVGDANARDVSEKVFSRCPEFDIVIDDGSHKSSDIIKSFAIYFPRIAEGGLFIAEDLHCSYWQQFEGGLFDPYSSITFFKRLADIINHEHWGVPKRRDEILRGILGKYGNSIDAEALSQVHSVEFINSMCVVRKASASSNRLGYRIVSGSNAIAAPQILEFRGLAYQLEPIFDQSANPWSARAVPPDEALPNLESTVVQREFAIGQLDSQIAERDRQISSLNNVIVGYKTSKSWKITAPMRFAAHQARLALLFLGKWREKLRRYRLASVFIIRKVPTVFRRYGFKGIVARLGDFYALTRREGWRGLKQKAIAQYLQATRPDTYARNDYSEWIRQFDIVNDDMRSSMQMRIKAFATKPLISIVMPVFNAKPQWLAEAIESVKAQIYPHWELCIADDASTDSKIRPLLEKYARDDARIKVIFRDNNGHISAASNSALELAQGEWVALLDHDDLLSEHALFWVATSINDDANAQLIYSDEDKIDKNGARFGPHFKSNWNADLFYSQNMISHLGVYRADLLMKIGGFRLGLEGSQDYDLALRCIERIEPQQIHHIPRVLYHWRVHPESAAQSVDAKPYAIRAGERALNEHFQRRKLSASAEFVGCGYRVNYKLPEKPPLVSLIIPTKNGLQLIRTCVQSILDKTTYPNYEILIVDNGSNDPAVLDYFDHLKSQSRVRVLRDDRTFNYSALNNAAVKQARGEVLGLLNNDLEVISPDWLSEMVSHAIQAEVGAVGAKLWYSNNTLQHGGVILGIGGVAGHAHKGLRRGENGYFSRANLTQSFTAVTAACMVIRKAIYEQVGGLNETDLAVAFNDVDFCLRVRDAGYRNVWTPYAELYHHESATRGYEDTPEKQVRFSKEVQYMLRQWGGVLLNDPAYNPNLTLDHEDFSFALAPRVELKVDVH